MSIYVIGDLHLSFGVNKPMNIFGDNWENHEEKIRTNWIKKVTDGDTVILPGDFSWAMKLEESIKDFEFLNSLPGKKLLSKGNHDYWWSSLKKMRKFLEDNNFQNIDFIYNNSYLVEDKIIVAIRGWVTNPASPEDYKILRRENERLVLSIEDGIEKYGNDKEIIPFIHYPPFYKQMVPEESNFESALKQYKIQRCYYAHLHGDGHKEAIEGVINGISYTLVSSDFLNFELLKI